MIAALLYALAALILIYKIGRWLVKGAPPITGRDWL